MLAATRVATATATAIAAATRTVAAAMVARKMRLVWAKVKETTTMAFRRCWLTVETRTGVREAANVYRRDIDWAWAGFVSRAFSNSQSQEALEINLFSALDQS